MPSKHKKSSVHGARRAKEDVSAQITVRPSKLTGHPILERQTRNLKTASAAKLFGGSAAPPPSTIRLRATEVDGGAALTKKARDELIARLKTHVGIVTKPARLSSTQIAGLLRELAATYEDAEQPPPLPDKAPELWSEREGRSENPVAFIRRVYAPWLGRGLIRPHVKALDPALYNAFNVWCHRNPDEALPELLTLSARIDEMVEDLSGRYDPEDLRKLGLALQMRHRKQK